MEENKKNKPVVEIVGLGKTFDTKNGPVCALDDINIQVNEGDIFGIIGMSGAGKSTLVRCMNLLERPTEGQVLVDGQDIAQLSGPDLRTMRYAMGMIFQQFNLLEQRTARKNILFAMENSGQVQGRGGSPGGRAPGARGTVGPGGFLSLPAFRRSEAAGGHRPGPGQPAPGAAVR